MSMKVRDVAVDAEAHFAQGRVTLKGPEGSVTFEARHVGGPSWVLSREGRSGTALVARDRRGTWVHFEGRAWLVERGTGPGAAGAASDGSIVAPMTGKVLEVLAAEGESVAEGQVLLVLSAMKMRLEIKAPRAGLLRRLPHAKDAQVEGGEILAVIEAQPNG